MKKSLLVLLLLLSAAPLASATEYTYSRGYYWNAGKAYTRSRYQQPGYYNGYSYVQPYYFYTYNEAYDVPATPTYTPPTPPAYAPGWKEKMVELAKSKDDLAAYQQALTALGYRYIPSAPGLVYGGGYSTSTYSTFGAQGQTVYGYPAYSVNALKDPYSTLDLNIPFQQSARLVQNMQTLTGQGMTDLSDRISEVNAGITRVAEANAVGRAAAAALLAARPAPSATTRTTVTSSSAATSTGGSVGSSTATGTAAPATMLTTDATAFLRDVGTPLCATCHSGATKKGSFDITAYPNLPIEQKRIVWARLITAEKGKRMPPDDGQHQAVNVQQLAAFLAN